MSSSPPPPPPLVKEEDSPTASEVEEEVIEEDEEPEEVEEEDDYEEEKIEKKESVSSIPLFLQSVNDLNSLHFALSNFFNQWNALQHTLDSIHSSIDARFEDLNALGPPNQNQAEEKGLEDPKESRSELDQLCKFMDGKALRKYISSHLADLDRLRKEVPEALKHAPDPSKLVLDAIGRFYLQGSKAFNRHVSHDAQVRRSCILLLEFYILSGCSLQIDPSVKEEAKEASIAWRNRLIGEGGIGSTGTVDALGLSLFLASFGIPSQFRSRDLYSLLRLSNLKKKTDIFRRSPILIEKMPDLIKDMITKEMHVEAVDLIFAFELGEKFPPLPLLSSFVQKTMEAGVQERRESQCSLRSLKVANERQLAVLKSVVKCLEFHKIDASEVSTRFNINQKIAKLEKNISKDEQRFQKKNSKRKSADAVDPLKKPKTQVKRPWPVSAETSHALVDRSGGTGVVSGNVHGPPAGGWYGNAALYESSGNVRGPPASGWYGNGALYVSPAGHTLLGMPPYSSGNGFTGTSAIAGQSFYHPQPPTSLGTGGRNLYQFADTLEQESYYLHSTTSSAAVPIATNPVNHPSY